jgi:hypothetical protein
MSSTFEIEQQRLLLAINRNTGVADDTVPVFQLGSVAAPDEGTTNASLIDNLVDNSDFSYSKDGYLNVTLAGGDVALECYNFYRHRLIKVSDISTTNGSPTVNAPSGPFKSSYAYPMNVLIYGAGGVAGETFVGTLTRVSDTQATLSTNALATLPAASGFIGDALAETAATALKATGHSLFAAGGWRATILILTLPRWERQERRPSAIKQ